MGWLRDQLQIQADGLSGHLHDFWPDVSANNKWLGGAVGEGWERFPYYLDGYVPLAFLLGDKQIQQRVVAWIDRIIQLQDSSGWLGPADPLPDRRAFDVWPATVLLKAMAQRYEADGDQHTLKAMLLFAQWLRANLHQYPLIEWAHFRWADLVLVLHWLFNTTGEAWLLDVAKTLKNQGYDWSACFRNFDFKERTRKEDCDLQRHVVNNAMGGRMPAVWWIQSEDPAHRLAALQAIENLDKYHGQVTGMFSGDEHLAGREPTQGSELCAVVEYMFSLEIMLAALGEPEIGDRLERVAYNALPATFTPDMWYHQYDQQVNQIACTMEERAWTSNSPDANLFGLQPCYGCCTANFHQGWPKLAEHLFMQRHDGGLAAVAYAPCEVDHTLPSGERLRLTQETDYPFRGSVRIRIGLDNPALFPLTFRVPSWTTDASVRVGRDESRDLSPGTFHTLTRQWRDGDVLDLDFPMHVRVETGLHGAVSIHRGPLVFSFPIPNAQSVVRGSHPDADFEFRPTSAWNYALETSELVVTEHPLSTPVFQETSPPVTISVNARLVREWRPAGGSAAPVPESPEFSAESARIELIPYGATILRVTEFPAVS